jgi:hypothetical protein
MTTFHSALEVIEHMAKKIEDDARSAVENVDPYDRPIALRYGRIAVEIGYIARQIRDGLDMVTRHTTQMPLPICIRMKDGKVFIELEYVKKSLGLLLDLEPVKVRLAMLDDREPPNGPA